MLLDDLLDAVRQRRSMDRSIVLPLSAEDAARSLQPIADATGVEIRWLGANGPRADAEIVSGDGREWRVVFTTDDTRG